MDERTYRRVFTETPFQTWLRHNGLSGLTCARSCRGCRGTGWIQDPETLVQSEHKTCKGTGLVTYRRTR